MAEEGEVAVTPNSQSQDCDLRTVVPESLQGLQPLKAPGVSEEMDPTLQSKSRLGLFRVFAGLDPGTPKLCNSTNACSTFISSGNAASGTSATNVNTSGSAGQVLGSACHVTGSATSGSTFAERPRNTNGSGEISGTAPLPGYRPEISCDPRLNMAAPSPGNDMMALILTQCRETKALYQQQQVTLDKLTQAVDGLVTNADTTKECMSEVSEELSHYETISSDDELSDSESVREPAAKKLKIMPEPRTTKLQKLKAVEKLFTKEESFGPAVHDVIASTVNKGLAEPVEHKSSVVQDLVNKYNRPENCNFLEVPKVNKLLYKQTPKDLKQSDKSLQRTQNYLTKGMIPLINVMHKTLAMESEEAEELFDLSLDAFNLLAYTHRDFSTHRRRMLLPAISAKYSALCNEYERFSSPNHLFGDEKELEQRLKEMDENKKLGKNFATSSRPRQQAKAGSGPVWGAKHRPTSTHRTPYPNQDFLGKRALTQQNLSRPAQYHKSGIRKGDQGQRKNLGGSRI